MTNIFRGDFINYLKSGKVYVLGTVTGKNCSGLLTNQGITNATFYRGREKKIPIMTVVKSEMENIKLEANWNTPIMNFIPKPIYELTDEEKEVCVEDAMYKKVNFNNKKAFIEFGENDEYVIIKNNAKDDGVMRCIDGTTYGNADKSYRTTYYFGGNFRVNNQNYCLISEGIEFNIEDNYVSAFFIMYAIETDKVLGIYSHSDFDSEKSDEEIEAELNENSKKKKIKRRGFSNEY